MTAFNRSKEERVDHMSTIVTGSSKFVGDLVQKVGPYLVLEILLPGGTVFALLLFLYRQRQQLGAGNAPRASDIFARAIGKVREVIVFLAPDGIASLWRGRHREHDGLEALGIAPIV
jgi:hypothetical protein